MAAARDFSLVINIDLLDDDFNEKEVLFLMKFIQQHYLPQIENS